MLVNWLIMNISEVLDFVLDWLLSELRCYLFIFHLTDPFSLMTVFYLNEPLSWTQLAF